MKSLNAFPVALCDAVLDAVGRLFDAEWATLVLTSGELPSSVPSRFTWCREPGQSTRVPSAQNAGALAARITNVPQVLDLGDGAERAAVLGVPMRLDHRQAELLSAERHRIGRDLHDGVAQCLVGIGMHLEWCHRHLDPASPAYGRLVASKELARAGLGRVRSAVVELSELERPGVGLGEALRDLAGDFRSAGQLRVSVRVSGRRPRME